MMPVMVFVMGCLLSTEKFTTTTFGNLMVVSVGVVIAAYGECTVFSVTAIRAALIANVVQSNSHIWSDCYLETLRPTRWPTRVHLDSC